MEKTSLTGKERGTPYSMKPPGAIQTGRLKNLDHRPWHKKRSNMEIFAGKKKKIQISHHCRHQKCENDPLRKKNLSRGRRERQLRSEEEKGALLTFPEGEIT